MTTINWFHEVEKRKDLLIEQTQEFLRIASVLDESTATKQAPFGEGVASALAYLLQKGEENQFFVKNVDGYAGLIQHGEGENSVGVLCHLDVVPAGKGWTSSPFSADIRENRIYARGAIDNKGPTMAAFVALMIVKELELPLQKRVQMIIGTDEESNWRCVDYYFKHEEMPTIGFAPDADFPIIHAEKGITDVSFNWKGKEKIEASRLRLQRFDAGERLNMVPDHASVKIVGELGELEQLEKNFHQYILEINQNGSATLDNGTLNLEFEGISAHGSTPENGLNAGVYLAQFLANHSFQSAANDFITFVVEHCDFDGKLLQINTRDEVSGPLTINAGLLQFDQSGEAKAGLNIRYPVTASGEDCIEKLQGVAKRNGASLIVHDHMGPNYVEGDHPLIKTLQNVYERQIGEEPELLAIGGGTYARSLKTGVAFGPMFPGREDVAHKKDEYIDIDDLLKMTAI